MLKSAFDEFIFVLVKHTKLPTHEKITIIHYYWNSHFL